MAQESSTTFVSWDKAITKRERSPNETEPCGIILNYQLISLDERYSNVTFEKEKEQVCKLLSIYLEHSYCSFQKESPNTNANNWNEVELGIKEDIISDEYIDRDDVKFQKLVVNDKKQSLSPKKKVDRKGEFNFSPKKTSLACDICNKVLDTKYNLIRHSYIHKGDKLYKCTVCPKSFTTKGNHQNHLLTHAEKSLHTCNICDKTFELEVHLKSHYRTHKNNKKKKPFECVFCHKHLAQKSTLRIHLRIHTGEKPYSCESCKKCFSSRLYLKVHRLTHSGVKNFQCAECQKCFTQKSSLNLHAQQHTGVKPFSCKLCDKRFLHKSYLKAHYVTHSGIKSFKCELCAKCFTQKGSLNIHMASHNK